MLDGQPVTVATDPTSGRREVMLELVSDRPSFTGGDKPVVRVTVYLEPTPAVVGRVMQRSTLAITPRDGAEITAEGEVVGTLTAGAGPGTVLRFVGTGPLN